MQYDRHRPKINLKTAAEIEQMRKACQVVAGALSLVEQHVKPGVTTGELDAIVEEFFNQNNAQSLFKGYPGKVPFPAVTCISVNEEVVHGVPGPRVLQEGDLVTIDAGARVDGWCGDSAITVPVGKIDDAKRRLLTCAEEALAIAIREAGKQKKWSQVAQAIQDHVHAHNYSLVEQYVGHGIGKQMHEDPQVPNYVNRSWLKQDFWLDVGLVIAVEPMVNMGSKAVRTRKSDLWTVETADGMPSVHVEHTIAITSKGVDILTTRSK